VARINQKQSTMNFFIKITIAIIKTYQLALSPIFGKDKCRFIPTCSCYAITAIEKKGVIKGLLLAFYRIIRCNPFNTKTIYDPLD
jgi:hypothetical protein